MLYLKGISTGEMQPVIEKLYGDGISGASKANVTRLKMVWQKEHEQWKSRDLSDKQYCYIWVDGIHFNVRLEDARLCILVAVGALADGRKELIAVEAGYRESSESWSCLLRRLRERGMAPAKLLIGDGNLGFWKAAKTVYPESKWQRCWVHKTANVLDKLPKTVQKQAKPMIHEMYQAPTRDAAMDAYDRFISVFQAKYPRATACLEKDKHSLFTFYEFPAEHWQHIRSTNVIESTFATVRLRTAATRGQGSVATTLSMVYKLLDAASKRWRRLRGYQFIQMVIIGTEFVDGQIKDETAA